MIGPMIGGLTSRPASQYPGTALGDVGVFQQFPYLLPNLITAVLSILSLIMIYLYLPETLAKKSKPEVAYEMVQTSDNSDYDGMDISEEHPTDHEAVTNSSSIGPSTKVTKTQGDRSISSSDEVPITDSSFYDSLVHLLKIESVVASITAYFVLSYIAIVFDEIVPLWALSSKSKGGLGYDSKDVGLLISFTGIPMILFTLFIFPPLARRLGNVHGFRVGTTVFAIFSICVMLSPLIVRYVIPFHVPLLPILLLMTSISKMATCMGFTCIFLLINASVPSHMRGSVNGLAMTFGSIAKAMGPFIGSTIFAASIHSSIPLPFSYLLVFLLSFGIAILVSICLPMNSLLDQ